MGKVRTSKMEIGIAARVVSGLSGSEEG